MRNVARELERTPAYVAGLRAGRPTIVSGYAAAEVSNVEIVGPSGPLAVRLSDPWTPDVPDAVDLRSFIAFQLVFTDELEPSPSSGGDLRRYKLRVRLEDGQTLDIQ